ncbi:MAG: HNH endonuclease [Winogradskyella sp.]
MVNGITTSIKGLDSILPFVVIIAFLILSYWYKRYTWKKQREARRDYYRNVYLKSDAWQRKRYVVLRRDNWKCVYCGKRATQVHHTRYAKYNIGKEPIDWLESVCKPCHDDLHN